MTNTELVQTLFPSKKQKLESIFNWIKENCSQQQKKEISKLIGEYGDIMVNFPNQDFLRCSHALDSISTPPTEKQIQEMPAQKTDTLIQEEITKRKQLINGLTLEIEELKHVKHKARQQ